MSSTMPAPLLFTPGPLTTSTAVKQAMQRDIGSWHAEFNDIVAWVRAELLNVAGLAREHDWDVVLLPGSGTYAVEAALQTFVPPSGTVAVLTNGAYGDRMVAMLRASSVAHVVVRGAEDQPADPLALEEVLANDSTITHVALVHCETTTGILNPVKAVGAVVARHQRTFVVDAMSSFAGIPIDVDDAHIDVLISSSNKCIEGVPGFAFVFARRAELLARRGNARTLSLDLAAQLDGFDRNGQFRFTPPTHVILAFAEALRALEQEGGVAARAARYRHNHTTLIVGMDALGIPAWLAPSHQSPIITAFAHPVTNPAGRPFEFRAFYDALAARGFIIYPGKLTTADTFRIGTIGQLFPADITRLVAAIGAVLDAQGVRLTPRHREH